MSTIFRAKILYVIECDQHKFSRNLHLHAMQMMGWMKCIDFLSLTVGGAYGKAQIPQAP